MSAQGRGREASEPGNRRLERCPWALLALFYPLTAQKKRVYQSKVFQTPDVMLIFKSGEGLQERMWSKTM